MLSKENIERIENGSDIIVDEAWIKQFPEDKLLEGMTIHVDHLNLSVLYEGMFAWRRR